MKRKIKINKKQRPNSEVIYYYVKGIKEKLYQSFIFSNGNYKADSETKNLIVDQLKQSFYKKFHYLPIECKHKIYIVKVKIENLENLLGAG